MSGTGNVIPIKPYHDCTRKLPAGMLVGNDDGAYVEVPQALLVYVLLNDNGAGEQYVVEVTEPRRVSAVAGREELALFRMIQKLQAPKKG